MSREIDTPTHEYIYSPNLKAFLKVVYLTRIAQGLPTNNSIIDNPFCISIFRSAQQSDI